MTTSTVAVVATSNEAGKRWQPRIEAKPIRRFPLAGCRQDGFHLPTGREGHSEMAPSGKALTGAVKTTSSSLILLTAMNLLYFNAIVLNFPRFEGSLQNAAYRVEPVLSKYYIATACVILISFTLSISCRNYQSVVGSISHIFSTIYIIPLCAIFYILNGSGEFFYICIASFTISLFLFGNNKPAAPDRLSKVDEPLARFVVIYALAILIYVQGTSGLSFAFLDFSSVYTLREDAQYGEAEVAARWVSISAYVASAYLVSFGLIHRRYFFVLAGLANSYLLYNTFGYKLYFISIFVTIGAYFFMRARRSYYLPALFVALFVASYFLSRFETGILFQIGDFIDQTFIRRFIYAQPFLTFAWHEAMIDKPMVLLSNSILRFAIEYPFDDHYIRVIAAEIFGKEFAANSGFFASGYVNFGLLGVFAYTFLIFLLMKIIDINADRVRSQVLVLSAVMPSVLFLETEPITNLATFGYAFVVIVSFIAVQIDKRKPARRGAWTRGPYARSVDSPPATGTRSDPRQI